MTGTVRLSAKIAIRPFLISDWPRLCDIHDGARRDELRRYADIAAFRSLDETAHAEGLFDGRVDVAEVDGIVQGFVAYEPDSLNWLYVHPDCYRRGVGRALLRHVLAASEPVVSTRALLGNEPALRLYTAEGFVVTGQRQGRLAGSDAYPVTAVLLERRSR